MNEPAASPWAVEVEGLTKAFGEQHALRGIDLKVAKNEHLVIFGPNGAGKTTLVRILSTLVRPSSGSIRLDGLDIRHKATEIRRKIGLVSHQTFLYDSLTVDENLRFYGRMYGIADSKKRINEVISWVRLETRRHDRVGTLSHGLQQRAAIARAVLHDPPVLFLDEPEAGLDPRACAAVREVLGGIGGGGRTVITITHNLERGLEVGDSIVILDRGRIVYQKARGDIDTADFQRAYHQCTEAG
jgi:heme exporter protein A